MIIEEKAFKVRRFLETYCVQSQAPWTGKPLKLMPWQWQEIILPLYGTYQDDELTRQYKKLICFIPKKQGKTSLLAGLALYHLLEQAGSEVYVIASDVQQAGILYKASADYVELSPLSKRLRVRRNIKCIEDRSKHSVLRVLSSEPEGKSGFNANAIFYDELAEWGSHARDVWDKLTNACIARKNPLQAVISTAQYDKTHIGYEQFQLAQRVKDNPELDKTLLPVIYSLPEDADWKDESNWWSVNPSVDYTTPKESFHEDFKTVQNNPLEEARFRTFRLCQWVGHSQMWLSSQAWQACGASFKEEEFYGAKVVVGIDHARKSDLCAYVITALRDGLVYLMPRFFIPEDSARRKEEFDNVPYTRWATMNCNLYLSPGDVIDPQFLISKLVEDSTKFRFDEVRFDPNGFELIRQELEHKYGFNMVEVPQTWRYMSPPTADLERRVLARTLRHPNNPILDWNAGNCAVREKDDLIMVEKSKNTARIDGIVASIIALSGHMVDTTGSFDRHMVVWA
jgi:phage terminase large subunit-like protein